MHGLHCAGYLSIRRLLAVTSIGVACVTTVAFAVGNDRALYVGGTLKELMPPPTSRAEAVAGALLGGVAPPPKIEGRLNLMSESEFGFDAGRRAVLLIPYTAIASIEYGLDRGNRVPKGSGLLLITQWDPLEQFTKDAHNLLTLVYKDQAGSEQAIVLELGKSLVRPTLDALQRRTGKAVEFLNVEACMLFQDAETCGYGKPSEMKGLRRVFVDAALPEHRQLVIAEIEKGATGLQVVESVEGAELILRFRGAYSVDPACPCEGGRGEVSVVQGMHQRVVLVFTGTKRGIWGKKPATGFGSTFVEAFKKASMG